MTNKFSYRAMQSQILVNHIKPLLEHSGFLLCEYGYENVIDRSIREKLNFDSFKFRDFTGEFINPAAMMVRYAPDFFAVHSSVDPKDPTKGIFFIEFKLTLTPIYRMDSWHKKTGYKYPSITPCDIGDIEREAWDVYHQLYPQNQVCLIVGSSYHPRLLVADWISKIKELFRDDRIRNPNASGSTTPHVNIDLGSMRTLKEFLEKEFQIEVDSLRYNKILQVIKELGIKRWRGITEEEYKKFVGYIKRGCR